MALIKSKPKTAGSRHRVRVSREGLYKGKPEKTLVFGSSKTGGRNTHGHRTDCNLGGGARKVIRIIDYKRQKFDQEATVLRIEYNPGATAYLALIEYQDSERAYIIAPQRLVIGSKVVSGEKTDVLPGNAMKLKHMPVGTIIHNIELKPKKGGQLARSAGSFAQLVGKDLGNAQVRLKSGEVRLVPLDCMATVGAVSNPDHQNEVIAKAGRQRWKGRRPHVRGVAMNPVDHPHGGGEGKTSGGRHPVSPWGQSAKGKKTRNNKRTDRQIVRRRSK